MERISKNKKEIDINNFNTTTQEKIKINDINTTTQEEKINICYKGAI